MHKELEKIIILDQREGKIYNLSQIVPPDTQGEKVANGMEKIQLTLTFTQDILTVQRYHENVSRAIFAFSALNGGHMEEASLASLGLMSVIKYRKRKP